MWDHRWSSKKGRWNGHVMSGNWVDVKPLLSSSGVEVGLIALWFQKVIAASKDTLFDLVSDLFTEAWNTRWPLTCVHGAYRVIHTGEVMLDFLYLQSLLDLQSLALNSGLGKWLQFNVSFELRNGLKISSLLLKTT